MDRLLFGDNQFFGVNHMSEEKARAQPMRFQDLDAVIGVLDAAYDEGIAHLHVHDARPHRARSATTSGPTPSATRSFSSSRACPTRTSTPTPSPRTACSARVTALPARRGLRRRRDPRRPRPSPRKDIEGLATLLIDAEMKMFDGLHDPGDLPAERRRRPAARPRIQRRLRDLRRPRARALRRRAGLHHHEPAAPARPCSTTSAIENPIVCSNINKIGFRMSRRHRGLRRGAARAASSGPSRCRCSPRARSRREEAIEWVCERPNLEAIVFGASSRRNIRHTRELVDTYWRP